MSSPLLRSLYYVKWGRPQALSDLECSALHETSAEERFGRTLAYRYPLPASPLGGPHKGSIFERKGSVLTRSRSGSLEVGECA